MKAKVRILAMLLTVLMVVGMLPLSLFAVGETLSDPINPAFAGNTLEEVKAALNANGIDLYTYQNFENIPDSMFTDGVMDFPAKHGGDWENSVMTGHQMASTGVNYTSGNLYPFEIKNQKDAFSIKKETNNKALFLGTGVKPASNYDNWFDIEGQNLGRGNDIIVSIDFKMGGDQIRPSDNFIYFITRTVYKTDGTKVDVGRNDTKVAGVLADGGIFLYNGGSATEVVGYLSNTEYTRITFETDLMNNKYYVYLDGVLVTPNGLQFMSDGLLKAFKEPTKKKGENDVEVEVPAINPDYRAADYKLAEVRVYDVSDNTDEHYHHGMYMDNLVLAGRTMLTTGTSKNLDLYTMDLSGVPTDAIGKSIVNEDYMSNKLPGALASGLEAPFINGATTETAKNSIIYFEESDGSRSIKCLNATTSNDGAQVYGHFNISDSTNKANAGQNIVFKGSFRAGSENIGGSDIMKMNDRTSGSKCDFVTLTIGSDRILRVCGDKTASIANIPCDRFVEIEAHLVCNVENGRAVIKVFIDGQIVYTRDIREDMSSKWAGKEVGGLKLTANTPIVTDVHFLATYKNHHVKFVSDDLHYRDVYVGYTNEYNAGISGRANPFANSSTGFVKVAGLTRYVENSVAKTENFVLGGQTYAVAESGAVIGKLSDGVVQSSYAPYVDWAHAEGATYITKQPNGSDFWGGSGTMNAGRHAQVRNGVITSFGQAALYTSYDSGTCPYKVLNNQNQLVAHSDINSYYDIGLGNRANNSGIVLDFDVMLGDRLGAISLLMIQSLSDPNGPSTSGHANRSDTNVLRIWDGWLVFGSQKIAKLSQAEFNRISFVLKTPDKVESFGFVSTGAPTYTEANRTETVYTPEVFAALEIVAQEKTPVYNEENVAYEFKTAAKSVSAVVDGKRTVVHAGTGTVSGTYTEIVVETVTENDVESVKVTEITGTVTRKDNYERTTVYTLNAAYSVYFNGVEIVPETALYTNKDGFKCDDGSVVNLVRMFLANTVANCYVKDYFLYEGTKPQQFYTMENGAPTLTSDQTKTPAKASDIKQGFVEEDSVIRYYDELGLPVINKSIEIGGETYNFGPNGNLMCDGENHINTGNGLCAGCGIILDGVSTLYGNGLVLGSDVKVQFYFDLIDANNVKAIDIGIDGRGYQRVALSDDMIVTTTDGISLYMVEYAVSGKDICTEITAKIVKNDDTYGTSYTYSAAQYAEDVKNIPTDNVYTEELKALAEALVVYGRNAAAVLVGNVEVDPIGEVDFSDVTIEDVEGGDAVVTLNKISLELKSNIKLKIYFNIDLEALEEEESAYTPGDYVVKYGDSVIKVADLEKDEKLSTETVYVYVVEYEMVAKDLATAYAFSIMDPSDTGIAATFSALYYAKVVVNSTKAEADEKNLAKAIKLYANAAIAYADSLANDNQ